MVAEWVAQSLPTTEVPGSNPGADMMKFLLVVPVLLVKAVGGLLPLMCACVCGEFAYCNP